jgi:DNA-binding NtrC family response regulator
MPLALHAKLLGVLEDRSFRPVGCNRAVAVAVRVVAATHADLEAKVASGAFRADLFYRLNIVPLVLPPLRERPLDILPLARRFVEKFNREFARNVRDIEHAAADALRRHTWPGNVRELRNTIERAVLFAEGSCLTSADLQLDTAPTPAPARLAPASPAPVGGADEGFRLPVGGVDLEALERRLVEDALRQAGGVKSVAAKLLRISRDQMRYRVRKLGETRAH